MPLSSSLKHDLACLDTRAYFPRRWSEEVLRSYHRVSRSLKGADGDRLRKLHDWVMAPLTLWPVEMCDALQDALAAWKEAKALTEPQRLLVDLLPEPPDAAACEIVAQHEREVQRGFYEHVTGKSAKYAQMEVELKADPQFHADWERIKTCFKPERFADSKGVIRRTMGTERNLRPEWPGRRGGSHAAFQTAFDAFCMRWNLYGMLHDEPLLLKLAVNLTPFATMIVIPAHWSFDSKRDVRWNEVARLHRARATQKQGAALKEGKEHRRQLAAKLIKLDTEAAKLKLRGEAKHAFLIERLGLPPETSDRTLRRLRQEFRVAK
ncbi:MAG: hypothetical protein JNM65_15770 [Verrucomicrobiaceae bacterium]|nr:hypothetical protein [Verrucomicrobiaceae bacterium]